MRDLCRRSYFGVCRGGVSAIDLCRRNYSGLCRGGISVIDLCRRSYIGVCRSKSCQCERSVAPQLFWCLQRRCLCM